jgi:hypothetical protein
LVDEPTTREDEHLMSAGAPGEVRRATLGVAGGFLLLVFGALAAHASRGSVEPRISREPVSTDITVIPHGEREVTVSWTLRARTSGARVFLYAGASVGLGTPLTEAPVARGVSSYEFVDRSEHDGQWLYWLVVVDDKSHRVVLGSLLCVSPGMDERPAPTGGTRSADPGLAEWPETEPVFHQCVSVDEIVASGDLFLKAPIHPPPEGRSVA